jgi:alpha-glucosidase
VPLPWQGTGPSFGFGAGGSHLPLPAWFAAHAVSVLDGREGSTLQFYRKALSIRRRHQTAEDMQWLDAGADALWFRRPGGWNSLTNFGPAPVALPDGNVLLASSELADGELPSDTTVWFLV